jgi:hypothetical protein
MRSLRETYLEWGVHSGDPRWSSRLMDSFLDESVVTLGSETVARALLDVLVDHQVPLTRPFGLVHQERRGGAAPSGPE